MMTEAIARGILEDNKLVFGDVRQLEARNYLRRLEEARRLAKMVKYFRPYDLILQALEEIGVK